MESVEFVQKCSKPNSTEVSYIEATPNPEFFRFSSELQLSDLNAISFDEQVDIIADEDKIGILNVSIKVVNEIINFNNRKYRRYIKVKADTKKSENSEKLELNQEIEAKITTDLELISESKLETSENFSRKTTLDYSDSNGYELCRVTTHGEIEQKREILFKSKKPRVLMTDATVFILQRVMPKIGIYEIELPFLDLDAKLVSISNLCSIGQRVKNFDGEPMDLVGIKRTHNLLHGPNVYNIWMFEDGHIALRESETGQIQISAPKKPDLVSDKEDELPKIQLKPLDWTKDIQLRSIYRQKAIEKSDSNSQYLHEHPQILQLLRDFYNATLSEKPEDIFQYAAEWFGVYKQN